ncbi:hypothetical protein D9M69_676240 [compost metagenome]
MVEGRQALPIGFLIDIEAIGQRDAQIAFHHLERKTLVAGTGPAGAEIIGIEHQALIEIDIGIGAVERRLGGIGEGSHAHKGGEDERKTLLQDNSSAIMLLPR